MLNSQKPLVSIAIPFYNAHQYVRETLQSVLAQTYDKYEVIIVNDGSKRPAVEEILCGMDLSRVRILNHEKNLGLSAARNTAFHSAKGNLFVPLDADDLLEPTFLSETVEVLETNPDCAAVYTQVKVFGDIDMVWVPDATMLNLMCGIPVQSTFTFRREIFETLNGYCTVIKRSPDVDFWLRALSKQFKLVRLEKLLYSYRKYAGSLSDTGKLTEVEDLAGNNPTLYLQNLDAICDLEDKKITELYQETKELISGFNEMYEGYLNLIERARDVESQLIRRKREVLRPEKFYEKRPDFEDLCANNKPTSLGVIDPSEIESNNWLRILGDFERDYFERKLKYSLIQNEFKSLKKYYLELHEMYDQMVDVLKSLGIRYQIRKILGLMQAEQKGALK